MGRPQTGPDQIFRHGLEVEGEEVEPVGMIELTAEEPVGIVALRDIGVFVNERICGQARRVQRQAPDTRGPRPVETGTLRTAVSLSSVRGARVA